MSEGNHASRSQEHAILNGIFFAALAFLITWGTGMLVVLSNHANLANGATQVRRAIFLPFPLAITLVMVGRFGPFLAAIVAHLCVPGASACAVFSVSFGDGEFIERMAFGLTKNLTTSLARCCECRLLFNPACISV